MPEPALSLIASNGEIAPDAPSYGEIVQRLAAAEELNLGQEATIKSQAAMIGRLKGKLEAADPEAHPRHKEMNALIQRWRDKTGHAKSRASKDRFDLIRARLNDGYEIEELELAIDGLAANPYVVNAQRSPTGKPSQRFDQMEHALKSGSKLEQFANLGHQARRQA